MPAMLPVDAVMPAIMSGIASGSNLVLVAPPGAGKTTRVPPALLSVVPGQVLVLGPRRIAARMAARRIAEETGSRVGDLVGYQVRFEDVTGPGTRLRFLTEGLLTRRLLSDPELRGVSTVMLDEFHERHLDTDLALALLRRLQLTSRPDLKLIVMSATLDTDPIARYLGDCPVLRSEGRLFDIEVSHTPYSAAPLEEQIAGALESVLGSDKTGDVLVFLPGSAEIRRAARACETLVHRSGALLLPLHGSLTPDDQDRAVSPSNLRKIILSTNIAESSITIEGVTTVIDSGLARIAGDSPFTGLPTLQVQRISKASATQRAGRAGRTRPGRAIRLYTVEDYQRRPDHDVPEIRRRELSQVLLTLRALGYDGIEWLDPPPAEAIAAASDLLDRLASGHEPAELARYPAHPRIARLIVESKRRRVTRAACRVAAVLASGERYTSTDAVHLGDSEPSFAVRQAEKQLLRATLLVSSGGGSDSGSDDDLRISLLSAFGDRVARLRSASDAQLANGKRATAPRDWTSEFFVAIDIEDRKDQSAPTVRLASAIQPDWLLELFSDRIRETDELIWNRAAERVDAVSRMLYDDLVIAESPSGTPDPAAAAAMLAARANEAGLERFVDVEGVELLFARAEFCALHSELRTPTQDDVRAALEQLCYGLRSFAELEQAAGRGVIPAILSRLGPGAERTLDEVAPERIPLKHRQVKVHYKAGQQPYIASRLQDFFGMRETPRIDRGKVALLVHLLAPNQRPVQVTADLNGFWQRLYPQLRKELSRRYPRHAWPENPM